ncbi:MAG: GGDEF domain-containing protein [Burkholderiales bacterium]|nr:GGDEF domain-containing protein [Burkholderiales bacterium]
MPNRDLFYDRLSQAASQARRKRQRFAVFFLDLDGFKTVNDTYGHQVGDMTLKEASRRLQACTRDVDTVARLVVRIAMVFTKIQTCRW